MAEKSPRRRRLRTVLKWFVISFCAFQVWFWWAVRLPTPDVDVPTLDPVVVEGDRVSRPGGGFLEKREGYWFFLHRGDAVTMGAEHAALGEFLIQRVEDAMFTDWNDRMPVPLRVMLPPVLLWQYRHMPDHIPTEQREELWGFSATYADRHSFPLSAYRRGMYYHALHDITQALIGNPYVDPAYAGACTAFAASGPATTDGHLVVGRNFDFEVFPLFDSEKVVHLYVRDGAIPVMSVSWMAMSGVVTGMNADGVWMSVNAAASEGRNRAGPPVSLWIRSILEEARSIEDVRRLLLAKSPMVSDIYVVGDGKTGESVVFERGQTRMGERAAGPDGRVVAANHMLSEPFEGDVDDLDLRTRSSTLARHARVDELTAEQPLSIRRGLEILRDRRAPGGGDLPAGNRNAIDALIATHSVVADVTARTMWVSTAPHTQGHYRMVDILDELEDAGIDASTWRATLPEGARPWEDVPLEMHTAASIPPPQWGDLPAGDLLRSGDWDTVLLHRSFLADAEAYLADDRFGRARDLAQRADAVLPGTPRAAWLEAKGCIGLQDDDCARASFVRYYEAFPTFGPDYREATDWLAEHGGAPDVARPGPDAP